MPGTEPAPTRRREATQHAILEATSALIAEKGVDGFTLSEVALRARINRALIYHYFQSRDVLIVQAIGHILDRHEPASPELGSETIEKGVRMHITHPEIARSFFYMLLNGRPLGRLGQRITDTAAALEQLQREHFPQSGFDATFALVILTLAELSWAFSREEIAQFLGMGVEEADRRFIASLRSAAQSGIEAVTGRPEGTDGPSAEGKA